jgi:DNA-binding transcriptional ArsR family regulator
MQPNIWYGLKSGLQNHSESIVSILKAMANEIRFQILVSLLDGPKSFQFLLEQTGLQKTALSNHLTQLVAANLVEKPDYGRYGLKADGRDFLQGIYNTWVNSLTAQEKRLKKAQGHALSDDFVNSFFGRK